MMTILYWDCTDDFRTGKLSVVISQSCYAPSKTHFRSAVPFQDANKSCNGVTSRFLYISFENRHCTHFTPSLNVLICIPAFLLGFDPRTRSPSRDTQGGHAPTKSKLWPPRDYPWKVGTKGDIRRVAGVVAACHLYGGGRQRIGQIQSLLCCIRDRCYIREGAVADT